jgi:hypothetical protein
MERLTVAVFDACVLYSAPLRDLLVELAYRRVCQGRWTDEIHQEWIRNLRDNRQDIEPRKLERTRAMMDRVRGCLVSGHLPLIPSLTLPDPDDRHVLAAAIHSGSDRIVQSMGSDLVFGFSLIPSAFVYYIHFMPRRLSIKFECRAWGQTWFLVSR